ncbi:MAG: hypothetical protein M5R40_16030 [Anaerolineae bacterium]|nr:hypothetical protein [Anaerolineae bacterium]
MDVAAPGPIETIIRLILIFLFGIVMFFGISERVEDRPPMVIVEPGEDAVRAMHIIDSVEVTVLESDPMQLRLHITGYQPDGCEAPVTVAQRREGNTVYVEIYRDLPADMICPEILVGYEASIPLEGDFEAGAYTINVNGYVVSLEL